MAVQGDGILFRCLSLFHLNILFKKLGLGFDQGGTFAVKAVLQDRSPEIGDKSDQSDQQQDRKTLRNDRVFLPQTEQQDRRDKGDIQAPDQGGQNRCIQKDKSRQETGQHIQGRQVLGQAVSAAVVLIDAAQDPVTEKQNQRVTGQQVEHIAAKVLGPPPDQGHGADRFPGGLQAGLEERKNGGRAVTAQGRDQAAGQADIIGSAGLHSDIEAYRDHGQGQEQGQEDIKEPEKFSPAAACRQPPAQTQEPYGHREGKEDIAGNTEKNIKGRQQDQDNVIKDTAVHGLCPQIPQHGCQDNAKGEPGRFRHGGQDIVKAGIEETGSQQHFQRAAERRPGEQEKEEVGQAGKEQVGIDRGQQFHTGDSRDGGHGPDHKRAPCAEGADGRVAAIVTVIAQGTAESSRAADLTEPGDLIVPDRNRGPWIHSVAETEEEGCQQGHQNKENIYRNPFEIHFRVFHENTAFLMDRPEPARFPQRSRSDSVMQDQNVVKVIDTG